MRLLLIVDQLAGFVCTVFKILYLCVKQQCESPNTDDTNVNKLERSIFIPLSQNENWCSQIFVQRWHSGETLRLHWEENFRKWRSRSTYSVKLGTSGPLNRFLYLMHLDRNRLQTTQLWKNKDKSPLWQSHWPVFCFLPSCSRRWTPDKQKVRLSVYGTGDSHGSLACLPRFKNLHTRLDKRENDIWVSFCPSVGFLQRKFHRRSITMADL